MIWPQPTPGLVVYYSYLWRWQSERREESGRKIRPCAVVLAVDGRQGELVVYLAPITHVRPSEDWAGVQIGARVKARLGLDDAPSWIITSEVNAFTWPGADLQSVANAGSVIPGSLPEALITKMLASIRENLRLGRTYIVKRSS